MKGGDDWVESVSATMPSEAEERRRREEEEDEMLDAKEAQEEAEQLAAKEAQEEGGFGLESRR